MAQCSAKQNYGKPCERKAVARGLRSAHHKQNRTRVLPGLLPIRPKRTRRSVWLYMTVPEWDALGTKPNSRATEIVRAALAKK